MDATFVGQNAKLADAMTISPVPSFLDAENIDMFLELDEEAQKSIKDSIKDLESEGIFALMTNDVMRNTALKNAATNLIKIALEEREVALKPELKDELEQKFANVLSLGTAENYNEDFAQKSEARLAGTEKEIKITTEVAQKFELKEAIKAEVNQLMALTEDEKAEVTNIVDLEFIKDRTGLMKKYMAEANTSLALETAEQQEEGIASDELKIKMIDNYVNEYVYTASDNVKYVMATLKELQGSTTPDLNSVKAIRKAMELGLNPEQKKMYKEILILQLLTLSAKGKLTEEEAAAASEYLSIVKELGATDAEIPTFTEIP